ncbi:MAG: hypothetical protein MI862_12565 [Desulfobacterales bacterium]|nr:hypothetical protein [Desulfobacterales bacterium]
MGSELVTIIRNSGDRGTVVSLDVDNTLTRTRALLTKDKLMEPNDSFLLNGNPLANTTEETTTLKELLGNGTKLYVGGATLAPLDPQQAIDNWNNFGDSEKQALFNQIEIYSGLIIQKDGFSRSFSNSIPVQWTLDAINSRKPTTISKVTSNYTFSKTTKEMTEKNVQSTSVSFTSPYASAKAEYDHEKQTQHSEEHVTTYLIAKFLVNKIGLQVNTKKMTASDNFMNAVKKAIGEHQNDVNGYYNLINVLDQFGYYVPGTFTLGGALLTQTSTRVNKYSDAETEMEKYSFGFSASFDGIGGGAAYSNADTHSVKTTSSNEYNNQTFQQIGGASGTNNDYPKWVKSLDSAAQWDVASYESLVPTIALIGLSQQGVGNACCNLINKFSSYDSVKDMQTMIDMEKYSQDAKSYFAPDI